METYDLLKEDLIQAAIRHHTREETEVLAGHVVDLVIEMAKEIAKKAVEEHAAGFLHDLGGNY